MLPIQTALSHTRTHARENIHRKNLLLPVASSLDLGGLSAVTFRARWDMLDMALAADCLFEVLWLELSMLIVAVGLLERVRDGVEDVG